MMDATDDTTAFRLFSDIRMGIEGNRAHGRHTMREGEKRFCALSWTEGRAGPHTVEQAEEHMERTAHFWRTWLAEGTYPDHPWRFHLQRSALALKGLTFMPTGALVAAPTTSLPETPRGERNWDYRYCWMRDASFTLWGLHALGLNWEADDFVQYLADMERNEDGSLQIMYGIKGEKDLEESTLEHLKGYEGARPGADRQRRLRPAPERRLRRGARLRLPALQEARPHPRAAVAGAQRPGRVRREGLAEPDQGIWEARGEPRHYVSSKLMCWVAMDRGARLAERRGDEEHAEQWQAIAEEIRADILERGVDERGVFRQHYDTDALDASNLLVPLVRFLPPEDERVRATVMAIRDELTEGGLVLRYRTEETDDGLHGEEGTFLICSFWLVSALSEIGEHREAEHLCERLLSYASPLGLYAEELEASSGPPPRQLPAGVHAPGADQRGHARDRRPSSRSEAWTVLSSPGSPGSRMRATSPSSTTRGSTGSTSRPRACSSSASTEANSLSCSRCLIVGNTSSISPARVGVERAARA